MSELCLKYTDERGEPKRVAVDDEIFTVGRHPENDLCISDNRLSREHLRIERFAERFYVSDSNSSNGTTLNGARLNESAVIRHGDCLNLGGGIEIRAEIISENGFNSQPTANESVGFSDQKASASTRVETPEQSSVNSPAAAPVGDSNSIPTVFFWLVPLFCLLVVVLVGGLFLAFSGRRDRESVAVEETPAYTPRTGSSRRSDASPDASPTPKTVDSPNNSGTPTTSTPDSNASTPLPKASGDIEKVEQNAAAFLRKIAQSDTKAFLTGKQAEIVNSKVSQLRSSGALAENFKAVKKNAAQFETLAVTKNLTAQFLATAALAKIGNNRGDPLTVAKEMLPILSDLKVTLDNTLADDSLLIIAAYDRGAAGKPRSLQSTLEALSKQTQNVSPRTIRTIWFLKEKDKITDAEYNFALQFIAIGVITQNPKDFNVNADAVIFN